MALGINSAPGGGIFRTVANLSRIDAALGKSLERIETGFKINRASDDPSGYIKAMSLQIDINDANTRVENNLDTLKDLKEVDNLQSTALGLLQDARDTLAEHIADGTPAANNATVQAAVDDAVAAIDSLVATSPGFGGAASMLGGAKTLQFGTNTTDTLSITFADLDSTDGLTNFTGTVAGGAAALLTEVETAIQGITQDSNRVGNGISVFEDYNSLLQNRVGDLNTLRNEIVATDDAVENSIVNALQIRQQAAVSSVGVQNSVQQNYLNLFA